MLGVRFPACNDAGSMKEAGNPIEMVQYRRPPITEAVIEIRLKKDLPKKLVDRLHARFKDDYTSSEDISELGVRIDPGAKQLAVSTSRDGYKLSSKDQTDILQITPTQLIVSRLAPYEGWENLSARARGAWKESRRITKYRKVGRLGVRYINRLDIPAVGSKSLELEDYLNVYPEFDFEDQHLSMRHYSMQVVGIAGENEFNFVVNTAVSGRLLIDHFSLVLDIDVSPRGDVPQKSDDIWAMFDKMREWKNRIFESSVTDKSRELFSK